MKNVSPWWRGSYGTTQLLGKDGEIYTLKHWNGEFYSDCYKSDMRGIPTNSEEKFSIKPIKKLINKENELYKLDGYEIIKKIVDEPN